MTAKDREAIVRALRATNAMVLGPAVGDHDPRVYAVERLIEDARAAAASDLGEEREYALVARADRLERLTTALLRQRAHDRAVIDAVIEMVDDDRGEFDTTFLPGSDESFGSWKRDQQILERIVTIDREARDAH